MTTYRMDICSAVGKDLAFSSRGLRFDSGVGNFFSFFFSVRYKITLIYSRWSLGVAIPGFAVCCTAKLHII